MRINNNLPRFGRELTQDSEIEADDTLCPKTHDAVVAERDKISPKDSPLTTSKFDSETKAARTP